MKQYDEWKQKKQNATKQSKTHSIKVKKEDNESLATTLEVYASILSAIHKTENDEVRI